MQISLRRAAWMLSLAGALCTTDLAVAQFGPPGGFGGRGNRGGAGFDSPTFMLRREDVQQELKLTEDQIKQITAFQDGLRDNNQFREFFDKMRTAQTDEERRVIGVEMQQFQENALKKIVKPDQWNRAQQLSIQRQGARALENEDVAKQLNLSDSQKEAIRKATDDYDKNRDELFRNRDLSNEDRTAKLEELRVKRDQAAEKVLNPQQRTSIDEKRGTSFTFTDSQRAPGFPGAPSQAPTSDTNRRGGQRGPRGDAAGVGTTGTGPMTVDGEGLPATLSFGGKAGEKKKLEKVSFNFRFAPWVDVLKLFSDASGLTLDLNDVPPGTFNYYDEREYTPIEALDVLNGYLIQKGYILVRRDEFLVVVNIDETIPPNLVPTVPLAEMPTRGRHELMTVIIPIEGIVASEAADEVKELLGPQGKVVALNRANKLIITDIGSNLRRIHELLTSLNIEPGDKLFKQFALKHVDAIDAENVVRDLFGLPRRGIDNVSAGSGSERSGSSSNRPTSSRSPNSQDPNARVFVAVDERTNTLLITAKTEDMKIVEETLKTIDVETGGENTGRGSKTPYFHVYELKSADPMEVTKTLNVLFPGTVVNEDGRARRIHIRATAAMHQQIEQTLKQLDGAGGTASQVAVIPLGRMDAYTATASIQSLFITEGTAAPVVQPHPLGTGLIVKGTGDQVNQIKLLLAQLDPTSIGGTSQNGNVRTIPLGGRNPDDFLKALEEVWNAKGRNPIRTITPSASKKRDRDADGTAPDTERTDALRKKLGLPPASGKSPAEKAPVEDSSSNGIRPANTTKPAAANGSSTPRPRGLSDEGKSANNSVRPARVADEFAALAQLLNDDFAAEDEIAQTNEPQRKDDDLNAEFDQLFKKLDDKPSAAKSVDEPAQAEPEAKPSDPTIPITVTINGGNLVIMSDDETALDRLEDVISSLSKAIPPKTDWTVFYLRSADALESATVLERLFPTSSVSTSGGSSSGMLGELTSGISSMGRGLMDMTGLNAISNGPQTLRIIPDTRTNSLFVSGPSHMVNEVEEMLTILDASETPEQLSKRTPRYVEVKYAELTEVAELVREIYKEELEPDRATANAQANPLAALMGGGGGGGRGGRGGAAQAQTVKMTIGIDARSNRLVIASSEPLYLQVKELVRQIDLAAQESKRTVRVISIENMKMSQLKTALGSVMPKVKVSSSRSSSGGGGGGGPSPQPQPQQPSPEEIRALIMQRGGGAPGGPGGGGRGR